MFTANPFTALTAFVSPAVMRGYIVLMVLSVAIGTAFDVFGEKKIAFFLRDRKRARAAAKRQLDAAALTAIAAGTLLRDIATFGEFCKTARRISHVLMFYGFALYLITTVVMVFSEPTDTQMFALPILWNVGALMVLVGGYWFFFFLRVNVVHDGHSRWRLVRADLFIVSLLSSVTLALVFEAVETLENSSATKVFAALYILATTLLFVFARWSKLPHMFYKPVVAFQRRVEEADGSSSLPTPTTPGGDRCPPSHT